MAGPVPRPSALIRRLLIGTFAGACLVAAATPAQAAPRLLVDWHTTSQNVPLGPMIFATSATGAAGVGQYGSGGPCGLPSGNYCRIEAAGARWEEADVVGPNVALTISLIVDAPWAPFAYYVSHPYPAGTQGQYAYPIEGTATRYLADGTAVAEPFRLAPGDRFQTVDPIPPRPQRPTPKLYWDRSTSPFSKNTVTVGRNRIVKFTGQMFSCGTQDDKACVLRGYVIHRYVPKGCRRGCSYAFSPVLGRFRIRVPAGETVLFQVKLSRAGLRYVKKRGVLDSLWVPIRYGVAGDDKQKRTSLQPKLRYRGRAT
jgi:hypothetical protein